MFTLQLHLQRLHELYIEKIFQFFAVYHLSSVIVLCGAMVISTVIVLILYNKSDKKHPMSPRVQTFFSFLGKIFCHKVQPSNGIIPTRIEVKEFQSEDDKPDQDQKEQETKQSEVSNNPSKEEPLCYCWKDAARILDKTFFVFYSTSVFILSVIQAYLLKDHEYPPKRCS